MASWTLWQPLIPRYQLTTKEITIVDDATQRPKSSPASPRRRRESSAKSHHDNLRSRHTKNSKHKQRPHSPRRKSEKSDCGNEIAYHQNTKDERGTLPHKGKATMYFTMASVIGSNPADDNGRGMVMRPSFPVRKSPYIDTLKQQQRINSARQSTEDPSTASPRHKLSSPRFDKQSRTVSQFPVTQIDQEEFYNPYHDNHSQISHRPKTAATSRTTPRQMLYPTQTHNRMTCKSAGASRDTKNLSINTIDLSNSSPRGYLKNPLYKDLASPRRYAVRKLDDATMFIDDDKIIFIKKKTTKNDVLLSQNCTEEANYIKHLRRLYLREPKDFAKLVKEPEGKKGNMIRERLEYELKTDHILNYYSRVDDKQDATLWAMAVEESRNKQSQQTPQTTPRSSTGYRRVESARNRQNQKHNNISPPRSARSTDQERDRRPVSARSLPYSHVSSENTHLNHDSLSDWNVFMKLNSRSILHERQFYLQTPSNSMNDLNDKINSNSNPTKEESSCDDHECRLCRLEKERKGKNKITKTTDEESNNKDSCSNNKNFIVTDVPKEENTGSDTDKEKLGSVKGLESVSKYEEVVNSQDSKADKRTVSTSTSDLERGEAALEKVEQTNEPQHDPNKKAEVNDLETQSVDDLKEVDNKKSSLTTKTYSLVIHQNPYKEATESVQSETQETSKQTMFSDKEEDERGGLT